MKSVSVLAFATGATATFNWDWNDATGYKCPSNTDNQCNTEQSSGFSWGDLSDGDFSSYGGFSWSGFTCGTGYAKRTPGSRFAPRTQKVISGSCGHDTTSSPSFGCSSSGSSSSSYGGSSSSSDEVTAFSVDTIDITTEFSCSLEFQYGMEDGSVCKQRSDCSSEGSTVKNTQCGGAKNVTIVYPTGQTGDNIPKESSTCSISIPTISFDCNSASSTVVKTTNTPLTWATTKETSTATKPAEQTTTPVQGGHTTTIKTPGSPSETGPQVTGHTTAFTTAVTATTSEVVAHTPSTSSEVVVETPSTSSEVVVETPSTSSEVVAESSTTSNSPVTASAPSSVQVPSSSVVYTTHEISSTYVTSYVGTSTVYSTSYQTITSCAHTVTDCPANSATPVTTTVVVAVSTTVCPITETQTSVFTTSHAVTVTGSSPEESAASTSENSPVGQTPVTSGSGSATTTSALSYPTIVPACISTWNYIVGCVDNSDTSCYCPDSTFVQNVYDCLYAYGETDEQISEAVQYFQGLCGNYAQDNPAVATGASITNYLTATATITYAQATTIVVTATSVVPCTNGEGSVIPSSSTTVTAAVSLTVPQVGLTTATTSGTTQVGVIPVSSYALSTATAAAVTGSSGSTTTTKSSVAPYATGSSSGSSSPNSTITGSTPIVTAGASSFGAGAAGVAFAVFAAVLAL